MFIAYENLAIKSECPNCKKLVTFEMKDANEKQYFSFRPHDCPKCGKKRFTGWKPKY